MTAPIKLHEPVLFVCRTVFQLLLTERIIEQYDVKRFDLILNSGEINEKSQSYFERVSRKAENCLIFESRSLLGWIRAFIMTRKGYSAIVVSDMRPTLFRIYMRGFHGKIFSFDDGAANFYGDNFVTRDIRSSIEKLRDRLLGVFSSNEMFERVDGHFTIDCELPNVVAPSKRMHVAIMGRHHSNNERSGRKSFVNIAVGQPFEEYMNYTEIEILREAFAKIEDVLYVKHPREESGMVSSDFSALQSDKVLEEIISDLIAEGHSVRVVGAYSTIMATARHPLIERYFLSVQKDAEHEGLARSLGCTVIKLNSDADMRSWKDLVGEWNSSQHPAQLHGKHDE